MRHLRISLPGILFYILLFFILFHSCKEIGIESNIKKTPNNIYRQGNFPVYTSYKDIPGVTQEEINTIERFRRSGRSFVYGMSLTAECFEDSGRMGGFAALYCQWLSGLFDLPFTPVLYEWTDLLKGIETGRIDFTGELSPTPERLKNYYMTGVIAERALNITRLAGSPDPLALSLQRRPRFGLLAGTNTYSMIQPILPYEFDYLDVESAEEAYNLLREGKIDAFIDEGHGGVAAIQNDLNTTETIPPIYNPVSMSTRNKDLVPIISVVQKYLNNGGQYLLINLYNQGRKDYSTFCFHESLTKEEREYVASHDGSRGEVKPIPFIMERDNYPWAFYNKIEKDWQGIALDVLKEIESVTALRFEIVSGKDDTWSENLAMLENGGGAFVSKLIRTNERKDKFLWTEIPYAKDNFALLSKTETPDLGINEILFAKVGVLANSAYSEYFPLWFPNHPNMILFQRREDGLEALKKGEIDLYLGTRDTLLNLTNYLEEPGYKINRMFYHTANSYFGFNRNEKILCSVINKAQLLVNTELLESRWLSQTFDYRNKIARERQFYLVFLSVLMGTIILLLMALMQNYKESKRHLKVLVKRRTRELEVQKNAAQAAYNVKNRFLANTSHEIRTPLNAIIGLSQIELDKSLSPESKENISSINRSGLDLLGMVNDLLDISNVESGTLELKYADYSLPAFISGITDSVKRRISSKGIDFQCEADENLPLKLHGDKQRVKQILENLLFNAIKFTNEGTILFRIGFENQEGDDEKLMMIFEICDTGIGIKNEHIQNLFSDYSQAETESNRSTGGIGMGLFFSKKLAALMDGDINVVSEYGKGSVFTAWIPQKVADKTELGKNTVEKLQSFSWKESLEERHTFPYARVLVVDDVPTNLAVARGIMRPYKMGVDTVLSGQESVDLIAKAEVHYDAIFMDHMMPGMDGIEATKCIRELNTEYSKSIPIIALTANALPENEELFLSNGLNAYMTKPINVDILNSVLNQWVRDEEKEKLCVEEQGEEQDQTQNTALVTYNIEGVDLAAGAAQFGGEENYLEIVKVFINDTPKLLENIQNCLDGFRIMPAAAAVALESLKNYTITVHGIKGSCYGICATPVGDLAKELEMAAKEQNLGRILELNNEFIQATKKLVDELKVLFPQKEEKPKLEKKAPDPATLQKLLDAAQKYNINTMLDVLDELDQYKYQENGDLLLQLRQATENYEYDEVIKLLNAVPKTESDSEILSGTAG